MCVARRWAGNPVFVSRRLYICIVFMCVCMWVWGRLSGEVLETSMTSLSSRDRVRWLLWSIDEAKICWRSQWLSLQRKSLLYADTIATYRNYSSRLPLTTLYVTMYVKVYIYILSILTYFSFPPTPPFHLTLIPQVDLSSILTESLSCL